MRNACGEDGMSLDTLTRKTAEERLHGSQGHDAVPIKASSKYNVLQTSVGSLSKVE
jgi:hypothetical protein